MLALVALGLGLANNALFDCRCCLRLRIRLGCITIRHGSAALDGKYGAASESRDVRRSGTIQYGARSLYRYPREAEAWRGCFQSELRVVPRVEWPRRRAGGHVSRSTAGRFGMVSAHAKESVRSLHLLEHRGRREILQFRNARLQTKTVQARDMVCHGLHSSRIAGRLALVTHSGLKVRFRPNADIRHDRIESMRAFNTAHTKRPKAAFTAPGLPAASDVTLWRQASYARSPSGCL